MIFEQKLDITIYGHKKTGRLVTLCIIGFYGLTVSAVSWI